MDKIEAVSGKKMRTIETEMIKALMMFSYGRVSYEKASVMAAKVAPIFYEASKKNKTLAHKGINWYAKELLKVI